MQIVQALRGRQALVTHAFPVSAGMGGCNFAGHGGIPFLMIPVFSHFCRFLCLGDGEKIKCR